MPTVVPNPSPGYFLSGQTISFTFDNTVVGVASTVNAAPPSISKYIAYDTLTPPNPFIAVTQDGKGNVVYDGGFPKFYNANGPTLGTPFASLNASFKYLYNALNFVSNKTKVDAGNKKVLILGDSITTDNYPIKSTAASGFFTSFTNICSIAGFTPTFKDRNDYVGGVLDARLSELENYCLVLVMSSMYPSPGDYITTQCINDIVTFRENGNGIILITDHGPDLANIAAAESNFNGFFSTANQIAIKFGSYFTGTYDRTPVNVGFLRTTYGDHPLYANMLDSESISAGGSESKVVVTQNAITPKANFGTINVSTSGLNTVQLLVTKVDGSIETFRWVYSIQGTEFVFNESVNPNTTLTETNNGIIYTELDGKFNMNVTLDGGLLGTIWGEILNGNGKRIGEVYYDSSVGSKVYWYAGAGNSPVNDGETITTQIRVPFDYAKTAIVQRQQSIISPKEIRLPAIINKLLTDNIISTHQNQAIRATKVKIDSILPSQLTGIKFDLASNIKIIRDLFDNQIQITALSTNIYRNAAETASAISNAGSVVPGKIFINAQDNLVWGYKNGMYQILTGLTAKDIFGAPREITNNTTGLKFTINTDNTIVLVG